MNNSFIKTIFILSIIIKMWFCYDFIMIYYFRFFKRLLMLKTLRIFAFLIFEIIISIGAVIKSGNLFLKNQILVK